MASIRTEFLFFGLSGLVGFIIDAGVVYFLTHFARWEPVPAQLVAFSVAVTITWLINRKITFAQATNAHLLAEWWRYVAANSAGAFIANAVYVTLVLNLVRCSEQPVLALAAGSLAGLLVNFLASRSWVFHPRT